MAAFSSNDDVDELHEFLDKMPKRPCREAPSRMMCTLCMRLNREVADECYSKNTATDENIDHIKLPKPVPKMTPTIKIPESTPVVVDTMENFEDVFIVEDVEYVQVKMSPKPLAPIPKKIPIKKPSPKAIPAPKKTPVQTSRPAPKPAVPQPKSQPVPLPQPMPKLALKEVPAPLTQKKHAPRKIEPKPALPARPPMKMKKRSEMKLPPPQMPHAKPGPKKEDKVNSMIMGEFGLDKKKPMMGGLECPICKKVSPVGSSSCTACGARFTTAGKEKGVPKETYKLSPRSIKKMEKRAKKGDVKPIKMIPKNREGKRPDDKKNGKALEIEQKNTKHIPKNKHHDWKKPIHTKTKEQLVKKPLQKKIKRKIKE